MTARLWEIEVPFRRPLRTAQGTFESRRSVILALGQGEVKGWAEAPAFPSGRFGTASQAFQALSDEAGWTGGRPTVPIAAAAMQAARADADARSQGIPLHRLLGASGEPVPARHPIGVVDEADAEREAAWLETHGILAIKIKVEPGRDVAPVRVLRSTLPYLDIGVDANGAYDRPDDPALAALDRLEVSFIEQPFRAEDLAAHAELRSRVRMAVCLDESVPDQAGVQRAIAAGAADQISVKLNRSGLEALRATLGLCREAGIGVQIGGTFDTSIGRRHLLAAATLPGVVDAAVGPPSAYLKRDIAPYPSLVDGLVAPEDVPGMGGEPDITELDLAAIRRV